MIRPGPTIVCVSANPALDRRLRVPALALGDVNRARISLTLAGGKAAHVAITSQALGARAVWIGFLGGSTGAECEAGLKSKGIEVTAIRTKAPTRVNLEAIEDSGRVTEVLDPGGTVTDDERDQMLRVLGKRLRGDWRGAGVVISGSLPPGLTSEFYTTAIAAARAAGSRVLLDTSGEALAETIGVGPAFVKPNRKEAEALLGARIETAEDAIAGAQKMIKLGAESAAMTLGGDGLVWLPSVSDFAWVVSPPKLKPISTVGCGDATMAGFAFAALSQMGAEATARLAAACGAAMCVTELGAQICCDDIESMVPQVAVRRVML